MEVRSFSLACLASCRKIGVEGFEDCRGLIVCVSLDNRLMPRVEFLKLLGFLGHLPDSCKSIRWGFQSSSRACVVE